MDDARILIAGGTGVFGRLLALELAQTTSARLVVAGRDPARAAASASVFGARASPLALDLREPGALREAARGCLAVVCAAGPFQGLPLDLPGEAVDAGAHWLDFAEEARWVLGLLGDAELHARATAAERAVLPGLSTVPALSGVLARWVRDRLPGAARARVTLFIGNRNSKGPAAIASALATGFRDPARVNLPGGPRRAYRFDSPDDVLLAELGLASELRVVLELGLAGRLVATLGPRVGRRSRARDAFASRLARASSPANRLGTDTGVVQVEAWDGDGRSLAAALVGSQRLAVLPAALAVRALLEGRAVGPGVVDPAEWLSAEPWVEALRARGARLLVRR